MAIQDDTPVFGQDPPLSSNSQMGLPPEDVIVDMGAETLDEPKDDVPLSYDYLIRKSTQEVLDQYADDEDVPLADISAVILELVSKRIYEHKQGKIGKRHPWKIPTTLLPVQTAMIMANRKDICVLRQDGATDSDTWRLAIYQDEPMRDGIVCEDYGTWATSDDAFRRIASEIDHAGMSTHKFNEVMFRLRDLVPIRAQTTDKNLVALDNGILEYETKTLMPFSSKYLFLTKSHVPYEDKWAHMPPPKFTNKDGTTWDLDSWLADIADGDPEIVNLHWETMSAILRPNVSWDQMVCYYSEVGNNGKGTLCMLLRNICGMGAWASIPLDRMGDQFALEALLHANAIIVDENNVDQYLDKVANVKTVVTNDVLFVDRKNKPAFSFTFRGLMVQCINSYPKVRDKTGSWYRRLVIVKFTKSFTGHENKDIKHRYLCDPDVLSYAVWKAMQMNHTELSEPASCLHVLNEYKMFNDPIREFVNEVILQETAWSLLPYGFLYDLYQSWWRVCSPEGKVVGKQMFKRQIINIMHGVPGWTADPTARYASKGRMDVPEPTIAIYDLKGWMRHGYHGADKAALCTPEHLAANYAGLLRIDGSTGTDAIVNQDQEK